MQGWIYVSQASLRDKNPMRDFFHISMSKFNRYSFFFSKKPKYRSLSQLAHCVLAALVCFSLSACAQAMADDSIQSISHPGSPSTAVPPPRSVSIDAPIAPFTWTDDSETYSAAQQRFSLNGNIVIESGDELRIEADHLNGNIAYGEFDAFGNVKLRELDTNYSAEDLYISGKNNLLKMRKVTIYRAPYITEGEMLTADSSGMELDNGSMTPAPNGEKSQYHFSVSMLNYNNNKRTMIVHNSSLWFGDHKILTIPRQEIQFSKPGRPKTPSLFQESFGYNRYDQLYAKISVPMNINSLPVSSNVTVSNLGIRAASATTSYTLMEPAPIPEPKNTSYPAARAVQIIRRMAQVNEIPVPENDPLRFHEFAGSTPITNLFDSPLIGLTSYFTLTATYNERINGRSVDNLQLTKEPEATLNISAPLTDRRPQYPMGVDPDAARDILKLPDWVLNISCQGGHYLEKPFHVEEGRHMISTELECRPTLVSNNLLFHPSVMYQNTDYEKWDATYRYWQVNASLEYPVTPLTGYAVSLSLASPSGSSPFIFDTLDESHEFDFHAQYGDRKRIIGAVLKYNLGANQIYTTTFTFGPTIHNVTPRITYDTRNHEIGFTLDAAGITY
jgi:hypothetical protein